MTPYVVINGISSKTIEGLIVQSLPPITKPKIRTSVEELDGRDGDVVQRLGYAAYDKAITIGLKGDYDVDDVIGFFNTSGKITFSNELDKYYKFAIYDTIDFNRLIRFKTANVNIHVQPFKYSLEEPPITKTGDGTIIDLSIRNHGNVYSKPKAIIKGRGQVVIYVNNTEVLRAELPATGESTIIIDAATMNATNEAGDYLNRLVTGDYNDLVLPSGRNDVRITGTVDRVTVENYSRWV